MTQSRLVYWIALGIVLGAVVGGAFPGVGRSVDILGEVFLNLLMMLVVPLVMLSMIAGITALGDIRSIGAIGWRTLLYYSATTALAVGIGIVVVNVVRPGRGITPGEAHRTAAYRVGGPDGRTVTLTGGAWERTAYGDNYVVHLEDQKVHGAIVAMTDSTATVRLWERRDADGAVYVRAEDGTRLPFRRIEGELVSVEPEVTAEGAGLSIGPRPTGAWSEGRGIGATLHKVVVGEPEGDRQGLIPRNVFSAMARMDILPLIVFSILLGAALSVLGEKARPAIRVLGGLNDAVMQLVHWVMVIAPIGIFGLIAARIGKAGGFAGFMPELLALGRSTFSVLLGLGIHSLVVLSLILFFVARRQVPSYARGVGAALLNAFSTASSSATLPLTLQGVEEENKVSNRTASFVLPLGATINMDGTALYESIAAIFIAQVYGISLGPAEQGIVFLTATLAAIGAAGIPEAGLVTMVIVLSAVGLPVEGVGLILTIDWLLDRFRTTVNVWGDAVGAAVIERFEVARETKAPAAA